MDLVELAQTLISIPSYVDDGTNEREIGKFVYEYLQGLGFLEVKRQIVEGERFNVVGTDGYEPRLMFCCHMDTATLSVGWEHDPFGGEVVGDRLYGLGAADMKGGMACLLHALRSFHQTAGLWLLFDVDEESYFKGMHKFLDEYEVRPKLAVLPEPGLEVHNGHRGLVEVYFRVRGRTGHAARPDTGKNAILGATRAIEHLLERLKEFGDPLLGESSCNLAFLRGGLDKGEDQHGKLIIKEHANKIPDIAEVVIDIRPAVRKLRAQTVLEILDAYLVANGFKLEKPEKRLDYSLLFISQDQLSIFEEVVRAVLGEIKYADISKYGYGEGQLLNEKFGVTCVYFGPGPEEKAHQLDEYVSIAELEKAEEIFKALIARYCAA